MLFNSKEFLIFLPLVLIVYHNLRHSHQNVFLVLASIFFYASWDWRFIFPLLFSTTIDYYCARSIEASITCGQAAAERRKYLLISIITNIGLLAFFKYCNFFLDSTQHVVGWLGLDIPVPVLNIILPIGISFYTFQALSYTIDVYRGNLHATRSFWDFFLAVLYFPHLVAGPIQRASNLIAQVVQPRRVTREQIHDGLHLIVWGFFKKVFIADSLAPIVNSVFSATTPSGGEVVVGVLAFALQIYGDFSGYTDIARGVAKLMGFEFMLNFNLPYFATNPSDFWQRWHISLSSWLRDYLYIPLGGNRGSANSTYRNLMITMVLGGLWHGAAWNFVLWGAFHGGILIAHRLALPALTQATRVIPAVALPAWTVVRIFSMFCLTCYGWLLFRATSFDQVASMTLALTQPATGLPLALLSKVLAVGAPLFLVQLMQYKSGQLIFTRIEWLPKFTLPIIYTAMIYCALFSDASPQSFIYFQF